MERIARAHHALLINAAFIICASCRFFGFRQHFRAFDWDESSAQMGTRNTELVCIYNFSILLSLGADSAVNLSHKPQRIINSLCWYQRYRNEWNIIITELLHLSMLRRIAHTVNCHHWYEDRQWRSYTQFTLSSSRPSALSSFLSSYSNICVS